MNKRQNNQMTRESGFSILEVIIATVVLMFAIDATITGAGYANRVQANAEATSLAAELADQVLTRLRGAPYNHALLSDPDNDGISLQWDTNGSGTADHGTTAEYQLIFEAWNAAQDRAVYIQSTGGVAEVWYEGYSYHIAWNVDDNTPFPNMKSIEVIVQSPPYDESIATSSGPWNRQSIVRGTLTRVDP